MIHHYEKAFRKHARIEERKEKEFDDNRKIIEERKELKLKNKIQKDKALSVEKGDKVKEHGNNIWEAVQAGVPVSALEDCIYEQSLESNPNKKCTEAVTTFDLLCKSIEDGYVLESSHPYSAAGINQSVQMNLMPTTSRSSSRRTLTSSGSGSSKLNMATNMKTAKHPSPSASPKSYTASKASDSPNSVKGTSPLSIGGKRGSALVYCNDSPKLDSEVFNGGDSSGRPRSPKQHNSYGTCILFDPRCNMIAGNGMISFQYNQENDRMKSDNYQGKGFFVNLGLKKDARASSEQDYELPVESLLPGVGLQKPLFIPSTQFELKFECNYYNPEDSQILQNSMNWGWKILAWPVQNEDHAKLQIEDHVRNVHIQQILASRRPSGESILHRAALEGNTAAVVYLLKLGMDMNMVDATRSKNTPLHYACKSGNVNTVNRLLLSGADPLASNCWGEIPLHEAARHNHLKIIKRLLKSVKKEQLYTKNYMGSMPIDVLPKSKSQWSYNVLKDFMDNKKKRRKINMHLLV